MGVSEPKKKLSKEEIIEILRRNAQLFKNEPEFVTYIVDLAIYLIEDLLDQEDKKEIPEKTIKASPKEMKEIQGVFRRFGADRFQKRACPMCGCPVEEGKRKCPNCDAMTF